MKPASRMKRTAITFMIMMGLLVPANAMAANRYATLTDLSGDVVCKKAGGEREIAAFEGMRLSEGDTIRTGDDGSVNIVYSEDTQTTIGSNSEVTVAQLSSEGDSEQNVLSVWTGKLWNKVKSLFNSDDQFDIETPTSVMGVRGTLFAVNVSPHDGTSEVSVLDGTVAVLSTHEQQSGNPGQIGEQDVTLNEQLQVQQTENGQPSAKRTLDVTSLVGQMTASQLVVMLNDLMSVSDQKLQDAQKSLSAYQATKDPVLVKSAVINAKKAEALDKLGLALIQAIQASNKWNSVNDILAKKGTSLSQISIQFNQAKVHAQDVVKQATETAKQAGFTQEQIDQMTNFPPVQEPQPPSRPTPAPRPEAVTVYSVSPDKAPIEGSVVIPNGETNYPVSHVQLAVYVTNPYSPQSVNSDPILTESTDPEGHFRMRTSELHPGVVYGLYEQNGGSPKFVYAFSISEASSTKPALPTNIPYLIQPRTVTVSGQVYEYEKPLANVEVSVYGPDHALLQSPVKTNSTGDYSILLNPAILTNSPIDSIEGLLAGYSSEDSEPVNVTSFQASTEDGSLSTTVRRIQLRRQVTSSGTERTLQ